MKKPPAPPKVLGSRPPIASGPSYESLPSIKELSPDDAPAGELRRDLRATLLSTVIHLGVLLFLALWVVPKLVKDQTVQIDVAFGISDLVAFDSVDLSLDEPEIPDVPDDQAVEVSPVVTVSLEGPTIQKPQRLIEPVSTDAIPSEIASPTKPSAASDTVEAAVDSVTGELEAKLEKGDLLVVWLFDASASLVDDRQRVAARLTPFYERIATEKSTKSHVFKSVVVSYGARMRERVPPTDFGEKIIQSVEDLPVDRSGNERVFDAVAKCAAHYREGWPDKQLAIVIWTDESGDDVAYLEKTIQTCQTKRVSVSVVGPSSVLGADTGLHSYLEPKTQSMYQLPVRRGPDTAMPERIELGYWYRTRFGGWRRGPGSLPAWVGGQDLEGILSGFSPYALTRLTNQTGGTYTIFDRPEDRGPFDPIAMADYLPSYQSIDAYREEIRTRPLRRAVMNAVRELEGKKVDAPTMMLFTKKTGQREFDFMRYYYTPAEFQSKLRSSRGKLTRLAGNYAKIVERALEKVSQDGEPESGLDDLLQYEKSPRWRAWYDLTRGRLLATSVRLEEYRLTVDAMTKPGFLASTTNHVVLRASPDKRSTGKYVDRAEEAERLLRRVVRDHRGTPWETLAQRELDFALGVGVSEMALTPNPGGPTMRQPSLPRF